MHQSKFVMEMQLIKGDRFNLSQTLPNLSQVTVGLGWQVSDPRQSYEIDASAFLLGENGIIPDERYFVFYNNSRSLDGSVDYKQQSQNQGDRQIFNINLSQLDPQIQEILFVVTIHEGQEKGQTFKHIQNAYIRLYEQASKRELARYPLNEVFSEETALEFGRLYKKNNEWRFQAVGQGYNAGLQSFVDKYHIESNLAEKTVEQKQVESPRQPAKSQKAFNLEKQLEQKAPHIFDLTKKAEISLQKANLVSHQAKVALCLDISGSMSFLYSSGKIQKLAEKVLALGCQFDDDGSIDIFLFGGKAHHPGEMTIDNFKNFIANVVQKYPLEGNTLYGKVMKLIRNFYFPDAKGGKRTKAFTSNEPIYVMFVTDGATADRFETEEQLKWSSYEPIFWQFMAIGKSNKDVKQGGFIGRIAQAFASDFSFLEHLDDIGDRYLDNADFFSVEDPESIGDQELYDLLLTEYPSWVKLARNQQLLR